MEEVINMLRIEKRKIPLNLCRKKEGLENLKRKENTAKDADEGLNMNKSFLQAKLLMRIKKGTCSIKTLASDLNKNESIVEAVLAYMMHDGYIDEIRCNNGCRMCPVGCNTSSVKMYTLTPKSIQYLKSIRAYGTVKI